MKTILVGAAIWFGGVSVYSLSYFIPVLKDVELQANVFLALGLIPIAWYGAKFYFKKESLDHSVKAAFSMLLTAVVLDVLITVPFLIIPYGGSYQSFFTGFSFWLIATEYIAVILIYSRMKANENKTIKSLNKINI